MNFRLRWTAGHQVYSETGGLDAHGNDVPTWADAVDVPAIWWSPSSSEPAVAGHDRVTVDVVMVVASSLVVSPHDRMVLDGKRYEVIGEPEDYDHGPGRPAGRKPVNLRRVDG